MVQTAANPPQPMAASVRATASVPKCATNPAISANPTIAASTENNLTPHRPARLAFPRRAAGS